MMKHYTVSLQQDRDSLWIYGPMGVLVLAGLYSLAHSLLRFTASPVIGQDDVVGNVLAQVLAPGYIVRQGPLYDIALWGIQQLTGPYLISFLLLKYTFFIVTVLFLYLSARHILKSQFWALLTACSVTLFYQIGWNIHEGVTHSAAMMCFIAASFWAYLRLVERGRLFNYILFGFFLAAGFLSKPTFSIFFAILLIASVLQKPLRARLLHPLFGVSLIVMVAVMLPHLLWLSERWDELKNSVENATGLQDVSYGEGVLKGLFFGVVGPLGFVAPLIVILPIVFPGFLKQASEVFRPLNANDDTPDFEWLLFSMSVIAFAIIFIGVLGFGIWRFEERYMHPFFLISLIGLMLIAMRCAPEVKYIRRYMFILLIFTVGVFLLRAGNLWIAEPFCKPCRQLVPYEGLAKALRDKGFEHGTLIAGYRHTAGNMRRLFPKARIICTFTPYFAPPLRDTHKGKPQHVAVVWAVSNTNDYAMPAYIRDELRRLNITDLPNVETVKVPWTHLWRPTGYRYSTWNIIFIPDRTL